MRECDVSEVVENAAPPSWRPVERVEPFDTVRRHIVVRRDPVPTGASWASFAPGSRCPRIRSSDTDSPEVEPPSGRDEDRAPPG